LIDTALQLQLKLKTTGLVWPSSYVIVNTRHLSFGGIYHEARWSGEVESNTWLNVLSFFAPMVWTSKNRVGVCLPGWPQDFRKPLTGEGIVWTMLLS
jgi:hypothetical protein